MALPARLVSGFRKADELLAIRDQRFNVELAWLRGWLNERHAMIPEWLRDATAVLPHWRSKARLAALTVRWGRQRFPGDDEAYQRLKEWRSWDKHLWEWEAHQRRKAALRRRDLYRVWAARLTDLGRPLALEEFDLRSMVRAHEERAVRRNRLAAAVGELRSALRTAATRKGTPVVTVPGRGTTQTCHCCEKWVEFDAKYELIAACPHCGEEWDQDYNAARNLARLGEQCEALAATS